MAFQYVDGLEELMSSYDGFIIDLWGVVHNGHELFPGVVEALTALKNQGKKIVFLSNSPRRSQSVVRSLQALGISSDLYDALHTSGEDAHHHFTRKEESPYQNFRACYPIMDSHHQGLLYDLNLDIVDNLASATFILNTGPGSLLLEAYEPLLIKAQNLKLPMICVNPDLSVMIGNVMVVCAGSIAKMYEEMGGMVYYHGKPYETVYEWVLGLLSPLQKERILAIGDSFHTDIQGANRIGIDSLLVLSGLLSKQMGLSFNQSIPLELMNEISTLSPHQPRFVAPSLRFSV